MPKAGDTVRVHYRGTLDNGEEFDSSEGREPLEFTVGEGQVIAGFDAMVLELEVGGKAKKRLEAAEAYGEARDDLMGVMPKADAPEGLELGGRIQLSTGQPAVVVEITDEIVRLDANHPLAGQALTFEIELIAIVE